MTDSIRKAAQNHSLNLDHYLREVIYARMDQITNPNNLLRDIDDARCCVLAELFRDYRYNCAHGLMTVYLSSSISAEGATFDTGVHTVGRLR